MKTLLTLVISGLFTTLPAFATADEMMDDPLIVTMDEVDLNQLKWKKRPVVVFADTPDDPAFGTQISLLEAREAPLRERDVLVITDTDPEVASDLRKRLRPRGFMLAIISKEGQVILRKPFPWDVREITRSIDKMPLRKREIRTRNETAVQ
ncbi:MAG: DUF4174 domain-containing protein [Pseudomonadota bacterium]